ncbi:MAG: class B sortase [Firmicutes bacterium]|nr:class B sortase [Bacillota bacterium]
MKNFTRILTITILTAAICLSGYELSKTSAQYRNEAQMKSQVIKYRPAAVAIAQETSMAELPKQEETETKFNIWIADLQNEVNKNIAGWLNIPDTQIDYPFVSPEDNDYYLRRDLNGNPASAGTLFIDYRCKKDFSDFNTIIYGHNMKNNSMFGDIKLFADTGFFEMTEMGTLFLTDTTYSLEFFAYMVVRADDKIVFSTGVKQDNYFEYVKKNARNYREADTEAKVVTLSTCSYEFNGARMVLLANIYSK